MASADPKPGPDGWKAVADALILPPIGLNRPAEGGISQSPESLFPLKISALSKSSPRTRNIDHASARCGHLSGGRLRSGGMDSRESGQNPLSPSQGLVTGTREGLHGLFGEAVPTGKIFSKRPKAPAVLEYYLLEQEGSRFSELETAQRCLQSFLSMHGVHRKVIRRSWTKIA